MADPKNTPPGPGVDSSGQAVIDPTDNVLRLVDAAVSRLDGLREAESRRMDEKLIAAIGRMDDLRASDHKRMEDLLDTKVSYLEKMNGERELHAMELRQAESARIDAIRQIDVGATNAATTLATTTAENLRNQVSATALAAAEGLAAALKPMQASIDELRKAQYEQQGQRAPDASRVALVAEMAPLKEAIDELRRFQSEAQGRAAPNADEVTRARALAPLQSAIEDLRRTQSEAIGGRAQVAENRAKGGNQGMWLGLAVAATVGLGSFFLGVAGIAITLILANK